MSKTFLKLLGAVVLSLAIGTGALEAQDKATLDLLVKKGLVTQSEADQLLGDAQTKPTIVTTKKSDTLQLKIGGYAQVGYDWIRYKPSGAAASADYNGFQMNRVVVSIVAMIGENWSVFITPEFDNLRRGDRNYLSDAGITWDSKSFGAATLGLKKVDFAVEEYYPTPESKTLVNSVATSYFISGLGFGSRHVGAYWSGTLGERLRYGGAVTNSDQDQIAASGGNNKPSFWANLAYDMGNFSKKSNGANNITGWCGAQEEESRWQLTAGLNVGWQRDDTGSDVVTQSYAIDEVFGFNPYLQFITGKIALTVEMIGAYLASDASGSAVPYGFNAIIAYKFDDWIEPVLRGSWIDTDGSNTLWPTQNTRSPAPNAIAGQGFDSAWGAYLGVNFYLTQALKFSTGYEYIHFRDGTTTSPDKSDNHSVRAQLQAVF